jgi:CMP-N,N'-diacetyllegionaminic acid synthase
LKDKNILLLGGKPLMAWSIEAALKFGGFDRVLVSTDSEEYRNTALNYGADCPFLRPKALSEDSSDHFGVVQHALEFLRNEESYEPEWFCLLQPTSPFRNDKDISKALSLASDGINSVVSISESQHHPYFQYRMDGQSELSSFVNKPSGYLRRQDIESSYFVNGAIYLVKVKEFLRTQSFLPEPCLGTVIDRPRDLQIDDKWDFAFAQSLLANGLYSLEGINA